MGLDDSEYVAADRDALVATFGKGKRLRESQLAIDRYLVAITTFLPGMAVLGAKRPQHWGWQFIVATLWVTLAWPALESLATGHPFALHTQTLRARLSNRATWCAVEQLGTDSLLPGCHTVHGGPGCVALAALSSVQRD